MQSNGRPVAGALRLERQTFGGLSVEREDAGVALVTLARPDRLNALDFELFEDLHTLAMLAGADRELRCIVITGEGRGFSAGGDYESLGELNRMPIGETYARLARGA